MAIRNTLNLSIQQMRKFTATVEAVRAVLKINPDIPPQRVRDTLSVLAGDIESRHKADNRPYSRNELAALLGVSTRTVDRLANKGAIRRIPVLAGEKNSRGYDAESVRALVEGRAE